MVKAFNQNFSVSKTQFCTEFSKIWHSILWEFLLFKLPKEIKDAKGNISMHYKTSLTIIRLDLMSYCKMDGRHKTTDTLKKTRLEAPKCAQPLSVRSNFSLEVFLCSNSWQTFTHILCHCHGKSAFLLQISFFCCFSIFLLFQNAQNTQNVNGKHGYWWIIHERLKVIFFFS